MTKRRLVIHRVCSGVSVVVLAVCLFVNFSAYSRQPEERGTLRGLDVDDNAKRIVQDSTSACGASDSAWSIGLYRGEGPSPLNLTAIEWWPGRFDDGLVKAWPVSNPVLTCWHINTALAHMNNDSGSTHWSSYVSDPFLFSTSKAARRPHGLADVAEDLAEDAQQQILDLATKFSGQKNVSDHNTKDSGSLGRSGISLTMPKPLYIFFETMNSITGKGEIGVAISNFPSSSSWNFLGIALKEDWSLSYPCIFEWEHNMYLLPEASQSGKLMLYKAVAFPLEWEPVSILLDIPVSNPSIVEWEGLWYLFVTDDTAQIRRGGLFRRSPTSSIELHIYHAETPLGPWKSHFLNPVMVGNEGSGARMAGRIVQQGDKLYRFGQDSSGTYGRDVLAFRIDTLSPGDFVQKRVKFQAGRVRKGSGAWNSERRHHVDVIGLADGSWIAALDGDYLKPSHHNAGSRMSNISLVSYNPTLLVLTLAFLAIGRKCFRRSKSQLKPYTPPSRRAPRVQFVENKNRHYWLLIPSFARNMVAPMFSNTVHSPSGKSFAKKRGKRVLDLMLGVLVIACILYGLCLICIWAWRRNYYNSIILFDSSYNQKSRSLIEGAFSRYTILIESMDSRTLQRMKIRDRERTLYTQIKHYGMCPSVSEVIVRHSEDEKATMEYFSKKFAHYKPWINRVNHSRIYSTEDIAISTRAVFFLKVGIIIKCDDIERMFTSWRHAPDNMYGMLPGLIHQEDGVGLDTSAPRLQGDYNVFLSSMILMDIDLISELKQRVPEMPMLEDIVNVYDACDDLLLSMLFVARSDNVESLVCVSPSRAMDLLYSHKIRQNILDVRNKCIDEFRMVSDSIFPRTSYQIQETVRSSWNKRCELLGCFPGSI